ncbi:PREDICTED: integrin alpha-10 [Thamnophis sirtalis]|uniref:Integrin alpha-10 n=1 Tax=Thamnophis sirtalis TaxID=35019 RepID=A0A6I9XNT4_9SAUR|nr:PREDICTED: integrin alpha-10 [Thamnophis sirtalis]
MSPEFRTTVKIQNLACYAVSNLSLLMAFPATGYQGREFLWVTRIIADNVTCSLPNRTEFGAANSVIPLHPEELEHTDRVNCTNAGCQVVACQLQRLERSSEVTIHLLRAVRNEFFRKAKFKTVKIISSITLNVQEEDNLFLLPKAAHQRQVVLEIIQSKLVPLSLWILIGSILGGLLLLTVVILFLWKVGFFIHKKPGEDEKEE